MQFHFREWEKELTKVTFPSEQPNKSPSLTKAILRAYGPGYIILSLATLFSEFVLKYSIYYKHKNK